MSGMCRLNRRARAGGHPEGEEAGAPRPKDGFLPTQERRWGPLRPLRQTCLLNPMLGRPL